MHFFLQNQEVQQSFRTATMACPMNGSTSYYKYVMYNYAICVKKNNIILTNSFSAKVLGTRGFRTLLSYLGRSLFDDKLDGDAPVGWMPSCRGRGLPVDRTSVRHMALTHTVRQANKGERGVRPPIMPPERWCMCSRRPAHHGITDRLGQTLRSPSASTTAATQDGP